MKHPQASRRAFGFGLDVLRDRVDRGLDGGGVGATKVLLHRDRQVRGGHKHGDIRV